MKQKIRTVVLSDEYLDFYKSLSPKVQVKYDYVIEIIETQYIVSRKFVKNLENTDFYEMRVSLNSDEYRTIIVAVEHDSFIESKTILLLNSFLKKGTKQYKQEIETAKRIILKYTEEEK